MQARIQKWGNSLALRVPKPFAVELGLEEESPVELSLEEGKLVVRPARQVSPKLAELLACMTEDTLHGEVDTGPAQGREVW